MNEINNKDRDFKGQQSDESVICFCRKHWITMLPQCMFFALFLVLSVWLFTNVNSIFSSISGPLFEILFLLTVGLSLFYIHYFFMKVVEHFLTVAIVTNRRIIAFKKTLFIINEKESCDLKMIQEINKHQNGILPNLLRYGDLTISLSQSSAMLKLRSIPNPDFHFRLINRAKQAYIQDRMQQKIEMREAFQAPLKEPLEQQITEESD